MWRRIGAGRPAAALEHRPHHGDGRSLADRAGDMDRVDVAVRIAQGLHDGLHAGELERLSVDAAGSKPLEIGPIQQ